MKRFAGLLFGLVMGLGVAATPAHAGLVFYPGERNQIIYNNYENLYDSTGLLKSPLAAPVIGDHLAGIFRVNVVTDLTGGGGFNIPDTTAFTGVFAQRVIDVAPTALGFDIILDNPTVFTFTDGLGDTYTLTDLSATGDMFAMYADPVVGGTAFTFQGALGGVGGNVANAQDGGLLVTAAIDLFNDPDNIATASVAFLPAPFAPVSGTSTATLSILTNNTGLTFSQITPITFAGNPGATGQLPMRSAFTFNTDTLSRWGFSSFDPAEVQPSTNVIPEVSSLWMLGMGLSGFGVFSRKKLIG